jgi:hypothetical protein
MIGSNMINIEAVVLYSSNDSRFAPACIRSLIELGIKVHIITYTHMWNGTPENAETITNSLIEFVDNPLVQQYVIDWNNGHSPWYWEGLGRYLGTERVSDDSDYILYIDIDEIIEPEKFKQWVETKEIEKYDSIQMAQYWYWREPIYQAKAVEYTTVLLKTKIAKSLQFFQDGRASYFKAGNLKGRCGGNNPFIHHYSWVRTKDEMLNKVLNWGHAGERNWVGLIEDEFSRPFNGRDFVHGYNYNIVDDKFNLK